MSLTSLLSDSQELRKMIPNLKPQLTKLNGKTMKASDWRMPILTSSIGKPYEAGTIGTAFDYVARWILTKKVGKQNTTSHTLVAENGAQLLSSTLFIENEDTFFRYEKDASIKKERVEGYELALEHRDELMDYIQERLESAKRAVNQFIADKISLEEVASHALFLAKLDVVLRADSIIVIDEFLKDRFDRSYFSQRLTITEAEMINNVVKLAKNFEDHFKGVPVSHVYLNPVFTPYSGTIGGADADFIYGSMLIDIKTSKKFAYRTIDWAQVLGYTSMAIATGMEIERAGIYSARYCKSVILNISSDTKKFLADYLQNILQVASKYGF